MDLNKFTNTDKANDGQWLELEDIETSEPMDVHIKLAGSDSDAYKKELRRQQDKAIKKGIKNKTAEQFDNEGISLLVACTLDWKNIEINGDVLECTPENARWIYKNAPMIREQVDEFVGDRSNFL